MSKMCVLLMDDAALSWDEDTLSWDEDTLSLEVKKKRRVCSKKHDVQSS